MATLIKNKRIAIDSWQQLKPGFAIPASGDVIVPLAVWTAQHEQFIKRAGRHGVLLENTEDPGVLVVDFDRLALIAVRFPKFVDGRGYSIARLLRRLGWKGELRAVGDVLRDQLFYMTRCGFDAFALRDDQDPQVALTAFGDFTAPYQPAIDDGVRLGVSRASGAPAQLAVSPW